MAEMIDIARKAADVIRSESRFYLLLGVGLVFACWILFGFQSPVRSAAGLLLLIVFQVCSGLEFWKESREAGPPFVRSWQILGAAALLWVIADGILASVWISKQAVPSAPSIWHWIRFAGYLAFLLGVAVYPLTPSGRYSRLRTIFDILTLILTITGLFWAIFLRPVLRIGLFHPIPFLWESVVVLLDFILIVLFFRIFAVMSPSKYPPIAYLSFSAAFILILLGDMAVVIALLDADLNLDFVLSCWLLANLAFLSGTRRIRSIQSGKEFHGLSTAMQRRVEFWLPIVLAYLTTGYILIHWFLTDEADWIGLGFIIVISTALVARQGVIAGQYEMRQFETLVNTVASPALICTPDGSLRLLNPAMKNLVAAFENPLSEIKIEEIFCAEEPFGEIFRYAEEDGWSGMVTLAGSESPYSLSLQPIRDENRRVSLLAGSAYDLSEILKREKALQQAIEEVDFSRSQLELLNAELERKVGERTEELQCSVQRLGELNEELKELDRLKSEFVTLVSHELRAPLTVIETGVELITREFRSSGVEPSETLALVQQETRRLEIFIETILDISALDAGRVHFESALVDIHVVVHSVLDQFQKTNLDSRLTLSIPDTLPPVLAESRALYSVLYHLFDNVVKYAPEGPVIFRAALESGGIQLHLCDSGPGIPAGERERVFELFHRLDSSDNRETYGYGLGLSIAKRFLEAMDGRIIIENGETKGVCVCCWLPTENMSKRSH
ncbi:MAG: hypothetical protein JXA25_03675 [Anaerolineales bacterium]|nr:hypothetical protein [Anaerolineales bacterium]